MPAHIVLLGQCGYKVLTSLTTAGATRASGLRVRNRLAKARKGTMHDLNRRYWGALLALAAATTGCSANVADHESLGESEPAALTTTNGLAVLNGLSVL